MTETGQWPAPLVRATLDLAILSCLEREPLHGYALTGALAERGFGRLKGGSLYPVLNRLEQGAAVEARWVEAASGPGRKEYAITDVGRGLLADGRDSLAALAAELGAGVSVDPGARAHGESAPIGATS